MTDDAEAYDALMQANLVRVFSERDATRRSAAISDLYAADAVLYEPGHAAKGQAAIDQAVAALLTMLPPAFVFAADGPAVGHHGLGRLRWRGGPPGAAPVVTGTDVARIEHGRIQSLHVFLDPAAGMAPAEDAR